MIEAAGGVRGSEARSQADGKKRRFQTVVGLVLVCVFFSLLLLAKMMLDLYCSYQAHRNVRVQGTANILALRQTPKSCLINGSCKFAAHLNRRCGPSKLFTSAL
ncbi:Magnesium transporter protein 1 [Operophtera brumata]|uniref:Magnesium transporter protein 1 n=1 Tax=Operophtera brumata TaxID=104452 RepID=A0A0L7L290_OPEBR|nr:Magnesium transporter protein 1 [Operophtera brumata]